MTDATQIERKKRAEVASKEYIDASGTVTTIEKATGLKYKSLPDGTICDRQIPGAVPGEPKTMLALFGWSTLSTNTASANRNATNTEDQFEFDALAVADRFDRITEGDWGTKGGGGIGINVEVLYLAAVEANDGNPPKSGEAEWKKKVTEDAQRRKDLRNHSKIAPIYERMMRERRDTADEKPLDSLLD